jgi:hypothetical protein
VVEHPDLSGGAHLSASHSRTRRLGPAAVRGVCVGTTALLLVATLTGCADEPITLEQPQVSAEDLAACNAFLEDVPRRLDGEERRKVNPANSLGAAWGDPAIIVRCGRPSGGTTSAPRRSSRGYDRRSAWVSDTLAKNTPPAVDAA